MSKKDIQFNLLATNFNDQEEFNELVLHLMEIEGWGTKIQIASEAAALDSYKSVEAEGVAFDASSIECIYEMIEGKSWIVDLSIYGIICEKDMHIELQWREGEKTFYKKALIEKDGNERVISCEGQNDGGLKIYLKENALF